MCFGVLCCRELKRWCKSFTRTEIMLTLLQLLLLVIFIGFLVFFILHFLVCEDDVTRYDTSTELNKQTTVLSTESFSVVSPKTYRTTNKPLVLTTKKKLTNQYKKKTFNKTLECTWSPSHKTMAQTRFFEILSISYKVDIKTTTEKVFESTAPYFEYFDDDGKEVKSNINLVITEKIDNSSKLSAYNKSGFISNNLDLMEINEDMSSESDGENVGDEDPTVVLALVKVKPPSDVTFGCVLTIVTKHWTLTAASCIESIEEMDTLDEFVIMEDYGFVKKGRTHTVSDVEIHPFYEGVNRSYDLAALKTESNLLKRSMQVELPTMLDHFMITIGERFNIFGYGPFRTIDKGPNGKRLRKVNVYTLPSKQCPEESESWALRHLWSGEEVARAPCGSSRLCAGVRYARGVSCNYCAGTPLLAGTVLYGLMSEGRQCGVACEPQLYVSLALVRDWLDSVVDY